MPQPTPDLIAEAAGQLREPVVGFGDLRRVYGFCDCLYSVIEGHLDYYALERVDGKGQAVSVIQRKVNALRAEARAKCPVCGMS